MAEGIGPEGVIEIEQSEQEIKEPGLGFYRVPRMNLRVFGNWIGIIPKARRTVGSAQPPQKSAPQQAEGRVDITDELHRYVLYRLRDGDRDIWVINAPKGGYEVSGNTWYVPMSETKVLDQDAFENALLSYLQ